MHQKLQKIVFKTMQQTGIELGTPARLVDQSTTGRCYAQLGSLFITPKHTHTHTHTPEPKQQYEAAAPNAIRQQCPLIRILLSIPGIVRQCQNNLLTFLANSLIHKSTSSGGCVVVISIRILRRLCVGRRIGASVAMISCHIVHTVSSKVSGCLLLFVN